MFAYNELKSMAKNSEKRRTRDTIRAARVKRTAEICRVSVRMVQLVVNGDRENEEVFSTYMALAEGENLLIQSVKRLVAFN